MKIVVFNEYDCTVDTITVDEDWIESDMRDELVEWYDDEEWAAMPFQSKVDLFIFQFCKYHETAQYMIDPEKRNFKVTDF